MRRAILLLSVFLLFASGMMAQSQNAGIPPFTPIQSAGLDAVNLQNLNANISIPIASSIGRGFNFNFAIVNDSLLWTNTHSRWTPVVDGSGNPTWGWQTQLPAGTFKVTVTTARCDTWPIQYTNHYTNFSYVDAAGTTHSFPLNFYLTATACGFNTGPRTAYASDNSGFYIDASAPASLKVTAKNGTIITGTNWTDANGNYISAAINGSETDWTDSAGHLALKIITSPTQIQYEYPDTSGTYHTATLKLSSFNIKTNFACSGVSEYSGTASLPTELDLPNGQKFLFTYEGTPNNSGYYTGRLQKITFANGGYYEYDYPGSNDSINCSDGTTMDMNRVVNDGASSATWNFVRNSSSHTTTVTTPQLADTGSANASVYSFNSFGREYLLQIYPTTTISGVPLRSVDTTWASNGTPATQVTTLQDGTTQSEVDTTYDSNGLLDSISEYDWGNGSHGDLLRTTTYTYVTDTNYTSRNLIDLVSSKVIKDGTGTVQYRQDTTYDGVALINCPTGVPQHDDTNYGCSMNYRGNPTSVTTYLAPGTPADGITKNFTYDFFGNLLTAQLNCCTQKVWSYSATTEYSQPDSVTSGTSPTQLTTSYSYDSHTGLLLTSTDPNNVVTNYSYDSMLRPTRVWQASGPSTSYTYNDSAHTVTVETAIDSSKSVQKVTSLDGLGRPVLTTTEDANNDSYSSVSAKYDHLGRAYSTSNPYTGSPSYWTTTQFDALGRPISITLPDNSATSYQYSTANSTNTVTVTDPTGKQREMQDDAAGRLINVWEPDPLNGNSLTLQTTYTYTVLDALTKVAQGSQTRTYDYDALDRLTSATTPEGGTVCFGTVSGGVCQANGYDSFGNLLTRTDARGVVTSYSYDGLNRLTGVTYTIPQGSGVAATSSVSYSYGTSPSQYNVGRLITMTDGVGSENYSYNSLEQMSQLRKVINGTTYVTQYGYNYAGQLTQITYPSGRVVAQSDDPIGRPCAIGASGSSCTSGTLYASGFTYNPASQVTGFQYGNGIYATFGFSSDRLQLTCLDYSTTNRSGNCTHDGTTKFGLNYSYSSAGSNNGQITGITDSVDNGRSATYGYDSLYRLTSAVTTGSANYAQWGLNWTYDRYGNRTAQTVAYGSGPSNSVAVDPTTNRITTPGYAYDLNGNMTSDGLNTLVYDGENRLTSSSGNLGSGTYVYDGNGLRVEKTSGGTTTVYIYSGSKVIAEYDNGAAPSSPSREYIYADGALLAKMDSSGTKYYHQDQLSNRLVTDGSGNVVEQLGTFPFGESWYNATNEKWSFTTYERDAESLNDYAMARSYVNRLARFSSPDPLAGDPGNPQSLNRYGYVRNDPVNLVDPHGTWCEHVTYSPDTIHPPVYWVCLDYLFMDAASTITYFVEESPPVIRRRGEQRGGKPQAQQCVAPNFLQKIGIGITGKLAKFFGKTVGIGAGGSAGAGYILGGAGAVSRFLVVSPNGQAAFLTSAGTNTVPVGPTYGLGAFGGFQFTVSNAQSPSQLGGFGLTLGAAGGGNVFGGGADFGVSSGGIWQFTGTVGAGAGGEGGAMLYQNTGVTPICAQ